MDLNLELQIVSAVSVIAFLVFLAIGRKLEWRLSLIVAVLSICAVGLGLHKDPETGEWHNRLKLGLDLAGGSSLLYEINVPEGANADEVIAQTIEVLKKRVDPDGVRSLVWREEVGNRIEIQMPRASREVDQKRTAVEELETKIEQRNISRSQVNGLLKTSGAAFDARAAELEKGVEGRVALLKELKQAHDALKTAEAALAGVDDEDARIDMAGKVALAQKRVDEAMGRVMATNITVPQLRRVLARTDTASEGQTVSPRQSGIEQLKTEHPLRVDQIEAFVTAYDAYAAVKGPLDDPTDLMRLLKGAGVLEFRIAVNNEEAPDFDDLRQQLQERGPAGFAGKQRIWVAIDDLSMFAETADEREALQENPAAYLANRGLLASKYGDRVFVLVWNTPDKSLTDRPEQEGWSLQQVWRSSDPKTFYPAVSFEMNPRGGKLLSDLTGPNVGRNMAMILDGSLISAPNINQRLSGSVIITGGRSGFSETERTYLVNTLSAGALQARLSDEPISIRTVGPNLGADNLAKGLESARDALIIVAIFMVIYYFFSGAIAGAALLSNIVIILGVMSLYEAAFTLPGIAGIVLTIGMCVDANVLIFERIREELLAGSDPRTALRLGYQRAFSSIVDSNITNLIVCVILYQTATVEVRGFAVTLGVGICATLFTSLFMTRAIFDLVYRIRPKAKGVLGQLPSTATVVDKLLTPNIKWISKRFVFFTISGVAIVASLVMVAQRGEELLDIEFRAGTEVAFELAEGKSLPLDDVRQRVADLADDNPALDDLANATVVSIGNDVTGNRDFAAFSVVSTVEDADAVSNAIKREFANVLDVQATLTFADAQVDSVRQAPVYPVTRGTLGAVINRDSSADVSEYRGGAAIVLRNIQPATTIDDIERRLKAMRLQPDFEAMSFRKNEVIGLTASPDDLSKYTEVAVVVADENANYFNNTEVWDEMAQSEWELVRAAITRDTSLSKVSNFTPTIAETLRDQAIVAMLLSFIAIVAYIWFRFGSLRYGMAAIAALAHDVIIALGCVAASHFIYQAAVGEALLVTEFKINLGLIAALLTIVGYSLNDTIVTFDRIRENRGKLAHATPAIIDKSINQNISRTVLTSFTTLLAVGMLYIFGGEGIRGFAFALIIGVVVGTYSSLAIACPLLTMWTGKGGPETAPATRNDAAETPATAAPAGS